jgi:hypothetical protein
MEQPKFSVGQRVIRIVDGKGSTVLEVVDSGEVNNSCRYIYYISYDEGETPGTQNEGKGWWDETSLQSE